MKISVQALGNTLKSQTELKLLDIFFLRYFITQLAKFLHLFVSNFCFCSVPLAHLVCDCIFEVEFSNDQWAQESRGHSPQHKLIIGYICPRQTALANVNRKCDPGRSLVNRRKQFCQKSQINFISNRPELKRDLGTACLLFTCLKYLGEKKRSNI